MRRFAVPTLLLSVALVACNGNTDVGTMEDGTSSSSAASSVAKQLLTGTFETDLTQSSITFVGKSNIINHDASFKTFSILLTPDEQAPDDFTKATLTATVDTASVESDPGVTGHMKRADFFDSQTYPQATFTSKKITETGTNTYDVSGDLTIKGITKTAVFKTTVNEDSIEATYDLPRKDFKVGNDSYGDKFLEPIVPVTIKMKFKE